MVDTKSFAVVGVGWFGNKRISALTRISSAEIKWIVDINADRAKQVANEVGSEYTTDIDVALSDAEIDCVLICVPNKYHTETAIRALRSGKHVLCEKPLARNSNEAEMIVRIAKESKSFLKVGSNHRYFANVMKGIELIQKGNIGDPMYLRGSIGHNGELLKERWFWNHDIAGGGTFLDNGCHLLDIARVIFGDFNKCIGVVNTYYWPVKPLEDNGFGLYCDENGRTALVQSSWTEWDGYMYFEVYGTEGYVIVDSRRANRTLLGRKDRSDVELFDFSSYPANSHELELRAFIESIDQNTQPLPDGNDGLRIIQMVEALYRSSEQGRMVFF